MEKGKYCKEAIIWLWPSRVNSETKIKLKLCWALKLDSSPSRVSIGPTKKCSSTINLAIDFCNSLMNYRTMPKFRNLILAIGLIPSVMSLEAQTKDSVLNGAGVFEKMYAGGLRVLGWYDVPIAVVDVSELLLLSPNSSNKPIRLPPTAFDKSFQPHVGVRGWQTVIAHVDEAGAAAFLGSRLLVNLGADLLGGNVTREDYQRTFWFYKSIVYTYSLALLTKSIVSRMRPDGSDNESFFSGHSSTAFCTASYISLELGDWYDRWEFTKTNDALRLTLKIGSDISLYAGATYVAYARMHDEKHYFSDVAVGAVVGTVVGTLMYRWHGKNESHTNEGLSFFLVDKTPTMFYVLRF
jgi:membrane-associated phospholipid phosphatase